MFAVLSIINQTLLTQAKQIYFFCNFHDSNELRKNIYLNELENIHLICVLILMATLNF